MSQREAFGPTLRRLRMKRGILLDQISAKTKISAALFEGLERNDFSRWPTGIYARSFVREYAAAIGADPDATVDEFCRCFAKGDRRAASTFRVQAEIVNHPNLEYRDEVPEGVADGDRREGRGATAAHAGKRPAEPATGPLTVFSQMFMRLKRTAR